MTRLRCIYYLFIAGFIITFIGASSGSDKIDRKELVRRHLVHIDSINELSPLTVGNGKFAFTADFTGLQSFPALYEKGIPLGTQSEWGWHSYPNLNGYKFSETLVNYNYYGRKVPYSVQVNALEHNRDAVNYFRQNPHRLHLGIIGLDFCHQDGSPVMAEEISSINQTLDPWTGEIHSLFKINGIPVEVTTYSHQDMDLISSQIKSPLLSQGLIHIRFYFPYPSGKNIDSGCDWNQPDKHNSTLNLSLNSAVIHRQIDTTSYYVQIAWEGPAKIIENKKHCFYLNPDKGFSKFSFSCLFTPVETQVKLPDFRSTASNNKKAWKNFWSNGGAIDFSECSDPRAGELERRVVLSQYLTKIQCSGNYPPQETGLTCNSWYGKFHLEMHYWHGIHFALWNRTHLLEKSLNYYNKIWKKARETAQRQGYDGIRWPKMTDSDGNDSPSDIGSFLIWQQPHIIYMAELCYRNSHDENILHKYSDIVFKTADFMASYARYDSLNSRYVLGPLMIPAQERFPAESTINSPFELAYWQWGLTVAQKWRERLKLIPDPKWDSVIKIISALPKKDGLYLSAESAPDSWTNKRFESDHPMVIGIYGMLPNSSMVDSITMKKTFNYAWDHWQWDQCWGWDFPMTAMAATRLGMPDKAIDALLMNAEPNTYLANGHNYQNQSLHLYLPGNGALLTAISMMCTGWDGASARNPGFPKNGKWNVKWEGLSKMP